MSLLNLRNPEKHDQLGLTIYRGAMTDNMSAELSAQLECCVAEAIDEVSQPGKDIRRFKATAVRSIGSVPLLHTIIDNDLHSAAHWGTLRVNVQGPAGKQGWHTDYVPEPFVFYPQGSGFLDFNPSAESLTDARQLATHEKIISVAMGCGDIAVMDRGGEIFHRGRNASEESYRLTAVIH